MLKRVVFREDERSAIVNPSAEIPEDIDKPQIIGRQPQSLV